MASVTMPLVSDTDEEKNVDEPTCPRIVTEDMVVDESKLDEIPSSGTKTPSKLLFYSREELVKLSSHPFSKKRPLCLDPTFNNSKGIWDPELWHRGDHGNSTTNGNGGSSSSSVETTSGPPSKRRSTVDPRERVREDSQQDDIVLSPQRHSFSTGCHVPHLNTQIGSRRAESPLGDKDRDHHDLPSRSRFGSGRMLTRDREREFMGRELQSDYHRSSQRDKDVIKGRDSRDFGGFRAGGIRDRDIIRDREFDRDRRSFDHRHVEREEPKDNRSHRDRTRYSNRRNEKGHHDKEEEPEWFSGGPTSQHDMIELRGFDDPPDEAPVSTFDTTPAVVPPVESSGKPASKKEEVKTPSPEPVVQQQQDNRNQQEAVEVKQPVSFGVEAHNLVSYAGEGPNLVDVFFKKPSKPATGGTGRVGACIVPDGMENMNQKEETKTDDKSNGMDIEEFLRMDSLPGYRNVSMESDKNPKAPSQSRFSQWFNKKGAEEGEAARNNNNQTNNFDFRMEPSIVVSSPPPPPINSQPQTVLQMLQRAAASVNKQTEEENMRDVEDKRQPMSIHELAMSGKVQSVEELESHMGHMNINQELNNTHNNTKDELTAFNKFVAKVAEGQVTGQPSELQQSNKISQQSTILKSSMDQQQQQDLLSGFMGGTTTSPRGPSPLVNVAGTKHSIPQQPPFQIHHDVLVKLLQVQQLQHSTPRTSSTIGPPSPTSQQLPNNTTSLSSIPPDIQMAIAQAQPTREMLARPEAQVVLRGLLSGDLTSQHLIQQLQNAGVQPRQREIMASILKIQLQSAGVLPPSHQQNTARQFQPQVQQSGFKSARSASPHLDLIMQQQQQQGFASGNTLQVQPPGGIPHRVPSPQELIVHTQQIMQSALLKKKLEEQKENFRKRQPSLPAQPIPITPSPLAFTPTSVMRKMTADKEKEQQVINKNVQSRKSGESFPLQVPFPTSVANITDVATKMLEQQQWMAQQQRAQLRGPQQHAAIPIQQSSQMSTQTVAHNAQLLMTRASAIRAAQTQAQVQALQQLASFQHQQQQNSSTAALQQILRGSAAAGRMGTSTSSVVARNLQGLANIKMASECQLSNQLSMGGGVEVVSKSGGIPISSSTAADIESAAHQLARWFSPDVLAQANAGKLPSMPPGPRTQALSVDEVERLHQSTSVLN